MSLGITVTYKKSRHYIFRKAAPYVEVEVALAVEDRADQAALVVRHRAGQRSADAIRAQGIPPLEGLRPRSVCAPIRR